MISEKSYLRVVRIAAWYDIISTGPLMTPWSFSFLVGVMHAVNDALGLGGQLPVYQPTLGIFGNLLGSVVLVWALMRISAPEIRFGRYDAACRGLYSVWMIYALTQGVSPLLLAYLVPELILGVAQVLPIRPGVRDVGAA